MFHLLTCPLQQWSSDLHSRVTRFAATCTLNPNAATTFNNLGEIFDEITLLGTPGISDYLGVIDTWGAQESNYTYPENTTADEYRQVSVSF